MPKYQTTLSWTEEALSVIEFECPEEVDPLEILQRNLPPLQNLKVGEIKLVSAGSDVTLN